MTELDLAEANPWTPADFILRGRYCRSADIYEALDHLRAEHGLSGLLLIAHNGRTILQTLTFASGEGPTVDALRDDLRNRPISHDRSLILPLTEPVSDGVLISSLAKLAPLGALGSPDNGQWNCVASAIADGPRLGLLLLALNAGELSPAPDVTNLLVMINATTSAALTRDNAVIRRLRDIIPADDKSLRFRYRPTVDLPKLLHVLRDEINAAGVAAYLFNPTLGDLSLQHEDHLPGLQPVQHIEVRDDSAYLAAVTFAKRKPVTRNPDTPTLPSSAGPIDLKSVWTSEHLDEQLELDELAVPIPSAPFGNHFIPYGVIVVAWSRDGFERPVAQYDLALIRNASLRMGMYLNQESEQEVLSELVGWRTATNYEPGPVSSPPDLTVPIEYQKLKSRFDHVLSEVARLTLADSASLRVLCPVNVQTGESSYALYRIAASPIERYAADESTLDISSTSVVAWVARQGAIFNASDVEDSEALARYGRDIQPLTIPGFNRPVAELAVPIVVDGRTCAVLNLESQTAAAFRLQEARARAFAEEIARMIADQRSDALQSTLNLSAAVHRNAHRILKAADELYAAADSMDDSSNFADTLKSALRILEGQEEPPSAPDAYDLRTLIESQLEELSERYVDLEDTVPASFVDPGHVAIVADALLDIFANVQKHMTRKLGSRTTVRSRNIRLGGKRYEELAISEPTRNQVPPKLRNRLFREPVTVSNSVELQRPHVGSYTAASLLRSIGGDIYVTSITDDEIAIRVSVPATPSG